MSDRIEMTFLAVPKPPDPYEDEVLMMHRCAAITYRRRHPECWPKSTAEVMNERYRAAMACRERGAAWISTPPLTPEQVVNLIANYK